MEYLVGNPRDDAVIDHETGLVQQGRVPAAPDLQGLDRTHVHALEKFRGIGSSHLDLAERADINEANALPHRRDFFVNRIAPGTARHLIEIRAQPVAG